MGLQQRQRRHGEGGAGRRALQGQQGLLRRVQVPLQGQVLQLGPGMAHQAAQQVGDGAQGIDEAGGAEGERIGRRRHKGQKGTRCRHQAQPQRAAQGALHGVVQQQLHMGEGRVVPHIRPGRVVRVQGQLFDLGQQRIGTPGQGGAMGRVGQHLGLQVPVKGGKHRAQHALNLLLRGFIRRPQQRRALAAVTGQPVKQISRRGGPGLQPAGAGDQIAALGQAHGLRDQARPA